MNRRNFLRAGSLAAGLALPALARAQQSAPAAVAAPAPLATPAPIAEPPAFAPTPETGWRRFELSRTLARFSSRPRSGTSSERGRGVFSVAVAERAWA